MKSLNDNLRDEFSEILKNEDIELMITSKKLDKEIIRRSFEKLLENKMGSDESSLVEKGRAEFETLIINSLKAKNH
jgi:hypothetical protein